MTKEDILQGNKLIAAFHGFSRKHRNEGSAGWKHWEKKPFGWFDDEDLKYHSSWDWLMPVCKKFDRLHEMDYTLLHNKEHIMHCDNIDYGVTTYDIQVAFVAISEAIQWYNNFQHK